MSFRCSALELGTVGQEPFGLVHHKKFRLHLNLTHSAFDTLLNYVVFLFCLASVPSVVTDLIF